MIYLIALFFAMIMLTVTFAYFSARKDSATTTFLMASCAIATIVIVGIMLMYDVDLDFSSMTNK
jgi:hypothetical protein